MTKKKIRFYNVTEIPPSPCPSCDVVQTAATGAGVDAVPSVGDPTVCFGCAAILQFDENLRLKVCTDPGILADDYVLGIAAARRAQLNDT